ncbi:MAG: glycoside hydrolase family 9 protein [Spirochaetia bacterium]|nr:glycoside hydrolase family 9 protein [Spirochaetia bacterium]
MRSLHNLISVIKIVLTFMIILFGFSACVGDTSDRLEDTSDRLEDTSDSLIVPEREEPTELYAITTAAPNVLVFSVSDNFNPKTLTPNPVETSIESWQINGKNPEAVYHYARAVDEKPKTKNGEYPVETRYWIYLELEVPLQNEVEYRIEGPYGAKTIKFNDKEILCESIKVNQAGYHPDSLIRYANLGVFLGSGGSRFFSEPIHYSVVEITEGHTVYTGTAEYRGDDTLVASDQVSSGEYVYRLNLAQVPAGGPYRIEVDGFGISYPFEISYTAVEEIAAAYTRGLYHQRCGIELDLQYTDFTRAVCHTEAVDTQTSWTSSGKIDVDPFATGFEISGGYHDAGDFDRRPFHTIIPILMLNYYEAFSGHFTDNQYSLPESGNGIPDFLDEALWGLKIWKELQILDTDDENYGAIMAGTETSGHPEYGKASAASDPNVYGTWQISFEVTAFGAGMMAQAARLLTQFPEYQTEAEDLFSRALLAWDFLLTHGDDDAAPYTTAKTTDMLYASLQLYLAAQEFPTPAAYDSDEFHAIFQRLAEFILVEDGAWPHQYRPGNIYAVTQTAHFISYVLTDQEKNEALAASIRNLIFHQAEKGGYMGVDITGAFYPQGVTKAYGWGAATAQGRYADVYAFAYRLEEDSEKQAEYFSTLSQLGDYALGLNPLGVSFVTGLGTVQPQSPLQLDSYYTKYGEKDGNDYSHEGEPIGNVPGILIFGPTAERSSVEYQAVVSNTVYPVWETLPTERRWADGWSLINNNEFTVWETMVWNICLYGVLNRGERN